MKNRLNFFREKKVAVCLPFLLLFIMFVSNANAQVGGISASKLSTICTSTVAPRTIEFEPAFAYSWSKSKWSESGRKTHLSDTHEFLVITRDLGFRFTYGVMDKLEAGVSIPYDASEASFGVKYWLSNYSKVGLALIAGSNIPFIDEVTNISERTPANSPQIAGGVVLTYDVSQKFSMDADVQMQKYFHKVSIQHNSDIFINMDAGYWLFDDIQCVAGLNYTQTDSDNPDYVSKHLSFNPGITIETAKNFLLVISSPITLYGENVYNSIGFGLALTITID